MPLPDKKEDAAQVRGRLLRILQQVAHGVVRDLPSVATGEASERQPVRKRVRRRGSK